MQPDNRTDAEIAAQLAYLGPEVINADKPLVIGHRGAAGLAPENTLAAFYRAFELGVDAIELDVHQVSGGLVVFHDTQLERMTGTSGRLRDFDLDTLRALQIKGGGRIPLLTEVLDAVPQGTGVNIELKGPHTARPVHDCLRAYTHLEVLVSSFRHTELIAYRHLDQAQPIAPLFSRWPPAPWRVARDLGAWSINLAHKLVEPARVERIKEAGYRAFVYTVNEPAQAQHLFEIGVHGIFTDRPDLMLPLAARFRDAAARD